VQLERARVDLAGPVALQDRDARGRAEEPWLRVPAASASEAAADSKAEVDFIKWVLQ
jgi:hypothetical protein